MHRILSKACVRTMKVSLYSPMGSRMTSPHNGPHGSASVTINFQILRCNISAIWRQGQIEKIP